MRKKELVKRGSERDVLAGGLRAKASEKEKRAKVRPSRLGSKTDEKRK